MTIKKSFAITIIVLLFLLFFVNILLLDIVYFQKISVKTQAQENIPTPSPILLTRPVVNDMSCPVSCLSQIKEATSSPFVKTTNNNLVTNSAKEFYVPFGGGSVTSLDWQDVTGLQGYIDSNNYQRIKSVVFEASVHVPTGNETVNIRLYNATDNHPVWFSEVLYSGGSDSQFLISQPITLDIGNKLYKVQMKTQLPYPALLSESRVHIITY